MENLTALRKFGKITEQKIENWYGKDVYDSFQVAATGLTVPVPIMGVPASLFNGGIVPRLAGGAGFSSLSDLINEATVNGKAQVRPYNKTGVAAPAATASQSLWGQGALPAAGANAAAAPGGTNPTNSTTGGLGQASASSGDTLHLTTWTGASTTAGSLMLYDYVFGVNINHATTSNSVTGVPTRYQDTTAAGNFISGRVTTVLNSTASNVTVTYMDENGNTAEAAAAIAIRVSAAVQTTPLTQPVWSIPLNSPDYGVRKITSIALSAAQTGNVDWFIGKPLAILPQPVANVAFVLDGINSAFNLVRVQDTACLALMEFFKTVTTATTISGMIQLVSG